MSKDLGQKIIEKLQKQNIKPKNKSYFQVLRLFKWSLIVFSLVISSLVLTLLIYFFTIRYWQDSFQPGIGIFRLLLIAPPYFWMIVLFGLILLADWIFRKTSRGYRYKIISIFIIFFLATILFGIIGHAFGLGGRIEEKILSDKPVMRWINPRQRVWSSHQSGLLAGQIINCQKKEKTFNLKDLKDQQWTIDYDQAIVSRQVEIIPGKTIRIIGKPLEHNYFQAKRILPDFKGEPPFFRKLWQHTLKQRLKNKVMQEK